MLIKLYFFFYISQLSLSVTVSKDAFRTQKSESNMMRSSRFYSRSEWSFHNAVEIKDFSFSFFTFTVPVSKSHGATDCNTFHFTDLTKTNLHDGKMVSPPCNSSPRVHRVSRVTRTRHEASLMTRRECLESETKSQENKGAKRVFSTSKLYSIVHVSLLSWLSYSPEEDNILTVEPETTLAAN